MKTKIALLWILVLLSVDSFANDRMDYSGKIVDAFLEERSPTSVIVEAINKGIFTANDYTLDLSGDPSYSLGVMLAESNKDLRGENFFIVNKENSNGLRFLLERGLDPNQKTTNDYYDLVLSAAGSCNLDAVKILLKAGAVSRSYPTVLPTVFTRDNNGANIASRSSFNIITSRLPVELDTCFNTFKFFVEIAGLDLSKNGCMGVSDIDPSGAQSRYFNYINEKYGASFSKECNKLDRDLMKKAGF